MARERRCYRVSRACVRCTGRSRSCRRQAAGRPAKVIQSPNFVPRRSQPPAETAAQTLWRDELLSRPFFADPLRRHDIAPITDGASAIVLAVGDKARELRKNPAWITGIEHRIETPVLGARELTTSPSTAASAQAATGGDAASIEIAEIYAPFTHQQLILTEAIGLPSSTKVNPSGGALAANPMFCAGLERIGFAAQHIFSRSAGRVLAHATSGPVLQQNLVAVLEGK